MALPVPHPTTASGPCSLCCKTIWKCWPGAKHEIPGHSGGRLSRTQRSQPRIHLSSTGCGGFHELLAVLRFPKVTLGQGGDSPHHASHPQDPPHWISFLLPVIPSVTWGPLAQCAILFTPLSTHKLLSGRGSGQMPGGHR